jgi:hypothetical protein
MQLEQIVARIHMNAYPKHLGVPRFSGSLLHRGFLGVLLRVEGLNFAAVGGVETPQ